MAKVFDAVKSALGSKPQKKPRMRVHRVSIERGQEGGYVAHHENKSRRDGSPGAPTGPYPISDDDALIQHIKQHLAGGATPDQDGSEEAEAEPPADPGAQGPQPVPPQAA